ncbi:MAG TPA: non-ribosomal peptide synthase/polyketide synthase, partial [Pyrinomonadaceae bacterium]|nr:non-ribosomal peptide synthase/polyketide synthase [Pyrinomonadaceae bacterium]
PLDPQALEESFAEVVRRHEVLRTSFQMSGEGPVQVIASEPSFNLTAIDLSPLPEAERELEAQVMAATEAARPFDLSTLPLLRATLLRLSAEEHILLLTMHHVISDGWSLGLMVKEVATLYRAFSRELPSPLPELQVQYADYALWQKQQLSGALLDEQLTYWREQLQNAPAVLDLPVDHSRPAIKRYRGAQHIFHLSEELTVELKGLSRAQRVTMFMLLLTAFKVLLWRYSKQEDIVVGTPIANREESQIEDLVGFFVNTLAVRTRLEPNECFSDLLKRVREVCLAAYQHQDVPFELVVEELAVERSLSYTPVFQVMFVLQHEMLVPRVMDDIEIKVMEIAGQTAKVDLLLSLEAQEAGNGFRGVIEYDTDLFEPETMRRLAQHYQTLLQAIVSQGDEEIGKLPMLGEEERQQLLVTWNETQAEYPAQSVSELFEAVVERAPEKVALLFEEQRISYDDLNRRANQLGHHLSKLGVGPETVVAVWAERSVETIVNLLAVLKAGGAYLPLEASTPPERLLFMMEDCGVKLLLTQQRLLERLPVHQIPVVLLDGELLSSESDKNLNVAGVTPEQLAYVMYTSGSTGQPKGIGIPHRGIVRLVRGANYANLSAAEVILQAAPISFDAATFEIWGSLLNGGSLVLLPGERASLAELGRTLKEHQVTTLWLTAGLFHLMVEERAEDLRGLRQLLAGGDVLSVAHVARALQELKGCQIINGYGPTENTTFTCCYPMTNVTQVGETVSIGRPISNTKVYLLDANLQPVPVGVAGELYIGGAGLARGYFNQPSLTAEKFIPDPFNDEAGGRLYRSGDLARYLDNGKIEFLGRMDQQAKIRGFRIEPGEIESVLAEHPAVAQSVVMVRAAGEREKTLSAYVVAEQTLSVSELRRHLQARLPEYMIPTAFIKLPAIPLTAHGKVDRTALLALETSEPDATATYVSARTLVEEMLVGIWANLLEVQRVGSYDNFFELGGHSLLAVRLLSRVRASFEVEVRLHSLFEQPTVAGLAEEIERQLRAGQRPLAMPIQPAPREGRIALSFAQQRLWFLNQLEPESAVYNLPIALRLRGLLNVDALERSLCEVVRRHETLRTTFVMREGEPSQVIAPALSLVQPVVELSALAETERKAELQRLLIEEARQPFDLVHGPLLRATLLRLAEEEHVALFTMHHIISDGWSMGVLVQEIATLYQAFSLGQPSLLPKLPVQYADFALSQRAWLQGEVLEEQLSYWREQLGGAPGVLGLPTDHVRPAVKSYRGAHERFALSAELTAALKAMSREQGVTLFMVLLAAFKVLLWRYSGQADVVVGTPIANRQQSEIEGLIGFFVNTLALRTTIEESESFQHLLQRVREVCLGAYQHQDVPFEMVVEEMAVERALNHTPIFQVMFALQNMPQSALLLEDVEISVLEVESGTAKFDLTLRISEDEGRLSGQVEYDTDLFEAASIKRLAFHYQQLLQELVRDAEQVVAAVSLLGTAERQQLLIGWNQTSAPEPDRCLHELFEAQVERTPAAVAVICEEQQLCYGELNQRANQLAHYLKRHGVGAEVLVGVYLERSVEMIVALLGILKAGGAFVPLDPTYPQERIAFMLADAGVTVLLTQEYLREKLGESGAQVVCLDEEWSLIRQGSIENPAGGSLPGNLAYVIYTSGSSGLPKGVAIEQRGLSNYLCWVNETFFAGRGYSLPFVTRLSFDASLKQVFAPLLRGEQVWVVSDDTVSDLSALLAVLNTRSNLALNCVPSLWAALLNSVPENELANRLKSLRCLFLGGESLNPELLERTFVAIPELDVWNLYGPTEATSNASFSRISPSRKPLIGRPIVNTEAYVLDANLQPVPIGVVGELYLGGVGLARGYLWRPELTAERFVPHCFSGEPGKRLYRTGDLACFREDGQLEYQGRLDQQVKVRGYRIELGEIDAVLSAHLAVRQSVTIVRQDAGGDKRLVSYIVAATEDAVEVGELRRHLKQQLPDYMIPSAFVLLDVLPLMPNGKIDRGALRAPEAADIEHQPSSSTQTPIEEIITGICAHLLKYEAVSGADNFFELGGHSLLATRLIARLRESLALEIPVRWVFQTQTLGELAELVEEEFAREKAAAGSRIAIRRRGETEANPPLSFGQQRLWFLDQLEPDSPVYNVPTSVRLSGPLNLSVVNQSLNEIINRHESLRTKFAIVDGQPVQVIEPALELAIEVVDLTSMPEPAREAEAQRLSAAEALRPFDLTTGPLLRATLLRLAAEEHILLLTMHHIISDGWSMGVLVREVAALYPAFSRQLPSPLPQLQIQYADYAVWQREQLGALLDEQLSYWREQLSGAPAVIGLPTDKVRPAVKSYRGARERVELSAELTTALKALSREQGVTLFMVLLAAFKVLLWRYAGQVDVVVGTPIANRQQSEIEGLIGFFVNTLALRTTIEGSESFQHLLQRVREVCLGAYQHQDVPFEMVVEEMAVERALSHTPLFQVMFVLQNMPQSEPLLEDVEISVLEVESGTAKFDLLVTIEEEKGGGLTTVLEYDTDLYERETARRMVDHFQRILEGIVQQTEACVGELALLSEQERRQLLKQWNETEEAIPELTLPELFERQVERSPERLAVEFGEERVSYQQLNRRANKLAHHLRMLGVGPDVVVGILMERSVETIVSVVGVLKAGGAYMLLDPDYPSERRLFMLADSAAQVILTRQSFVEELGEQKAHVLCLDAQWASIAEESEENPHSGVTPDNLAYVIYTSGSTGRPKGIAMPQRPLMNLLAFQTHNFDASKSPRTLQFASLSFDVSFQEIFSTFCAGATLLLIDEEVRHDPKALWQVLVEKNVERLFLPFVALQQLAEVVETEETVPLHLREVITAGEQLKVTGEIRQMFEKLAGCAFVNHYGPSETHAATAWQLPGMPDQWPHLPPIGKPISNTQIYLLDEWLQPVPIGVVGELYIGGECLARGYVDRPQQTAEKFIPHPFSETGGERLYKTGDLARYRNDGCLDFMGRSDHQVKVRGFRIEIGEIEFALKQHPAVKQAVVHAWDDTTGQKRLAAYVVAAPEESVATAELRNHLRELLPEYMIPSAFVLLAELPLTPSGKVDRRALSAPDSLRSETEGYAAPRTPIEEVLANIWANLLGFEQVGINDNFFELGGHSLLATRVMSQIRDALQIDLALRQLFEHPTIAELGQSIEKVRQQSSLQPLTLTARPEAIPLSFAQQRLWFLDQMEPGNSFYNISSALRLNGPLDHQALEQSLAEIIHRHEVLRTSFQTSGEGPVQVIVSEPYFNLPVIDLSPLPEAERELEAQAMAATEAARPFDLSTLPLLRATLLRLAAEEHVLLLTMHHIISDGWSLGLMVKEVATLYQAFSRQLPSPLPELEIQYADYALWQRQQLSGAVLDEQLTYWREQLQSAPAVLPLPADHPRPAIKRYRGAHQSFHISEELAAELKALSRAQRVTMFMLLLAAFKVLLWRYSGQEDIVVGTPIANREESQIEDLIGFFVNTLAMRTRLEPNERFADLLKRVREECLTGYQHQTVPFELVVEELAVERSLSYTPIFQVMFVLQNEMLVPREIEDIEIKAMEVEAGTAKVDLLMAIGAQETGAGLRGVIEYDTDLFEPETMRRLGQHYQTLLQAIVSKSDERIGKLPLLGEEERQQLLVSWNETQAEYPAQSVSELFEAVVARTPEKVAVLFEQQAISYDDLNRRANQLGHHLRHFGVGPETVVAVLAERSVEAIVSLLAVLKAGGAYLPLEPSTPSERLLFMMEDCGAKLLLTQQRLLERLPAHQVPVVLLDADQHLISIESEQNLSATGVTPEHLAYLMYTSGSTGKPKGIGIPHRAVVRLVRGANYANLNAGEVILQAAPVSFDAATFEIWGSLLNGGSLVLLPGERASLEELGRTLKEHQVTTLWLTAGLFHLMIEERAEDLQGLRQLLAGGDVLSVSHVERALRELKNCQIINGYGPTENTTFTCCYPMTSVAQVGETVAIGRPISNTKVYLLDANLQPVPLGVTGELYIGGDGLARGYSNHPSLTAEKFIPDPFTQEQGGRLYRSGDLARYLSDGRIEFLGRLDHQIKIRGFRIEPGEVETLLEQHEEIKQAVVAAREADAGGKRLVAYLVAQSEPPATAELQAFLKQRLPEYMVPSAFIFLSELPLTPSGKINRRALPEPGRPELSDNYVGPRTETEALVCSLWAGILKIERVGIYDNFFELGGHSLLATQLVSRLREAFRVEIPLRLLFEQPTVAELTQGIEVELAVGRNSSPIKRLSLKGPQPLSFSQRRLWFLDQLTPGSAVYNIPVALRLNGSLDLLALQQAFTEILRRQELLRTRFAVIDADPVQLVSEPADFDLRVLDLSHLESPEIEHEVQRLAIAEAHGPFDLTQGPLFRATLLRLAAAEHVLLFTMHHIISDGWSMRVLIREMTTLYEAFAADRPSPLVDLPVQYGDYAVWQREQLQGERLEEQLQYWREQLQGAPALLELPTEKPRPPVQSYRGAELRLEVTPETTRALKELSQQHGVTLFMTLLAAFQALLYRYTGQDDIVVGTPVAGRTRAETEGLIGFFLNTLALRVSLKGEPTFATLLSRVREACLGAYAHQDVPFEQLLEELAPERTLSHTPIFQVMFNMLNLDYAGEQIELDGITIAALPVVQQEHLAKFDLELYARERGDGLQLVLVYSELFTSVEMERMLDHLRTLLQAVAAEPGQCLAALALSTDLGKQHPTQDNLIRPTNPFVTFANEEIEQTIQERFEQQVRSYPGNIAIKIGKESWTYKELNHKANQIARAVLAASGDGDERIALLLNHDALMVAGILGVLKAGKTYVPLNTAHPEHRLIEVLKDSESAGLLTDNANLLFAEALNKEGLPVINLDRIDSSLPGDNLQVRCAPDSLAYILYTSGSTGKPKGVVQNHRNVLHHIRVYTNNLHICANDKVSLFSSYSFDAAVMDIFGAVLNGATLCPIDI